MFCYSTPARYLLDWAHLAHQDVTGPRPQPSGEADPTLQPSGEAKLAHGRRARQNQTPVIRARNTVVPLSVWEFLTFDGY